MNVAILIPCYNEEATIAAVIEDFHKVLPRAVIYVYDNNCTDRTAEIASQYEYCIVRKCHVQGKGATVKKMFHDIDADVYLMVDGDMTYPAVSARKLVGGVGLKNYDMVLGDRLSSNYYTTNKRPFHNLGNWLVKFLVNLLYHGHVTDIMTGYRAFSKRFVKSIDIQSAGFEIETEMTIFALKNKYKIGSVPIEYKDRPDGSESKLNTFSDGRKVVWFLLRSKFFSKKS